MESYHILDHPASAPILLRLVVETFSADVLAIQKSILVMKEKVLI